jgi:hypothetical protein
VFDLLNRLPQDEQVVAELFEPDLEWHGSHPINDGVGVDGWTASALASLKGAFPDLERRDDIVTAGVFKDRLWIACTGHYAGIFDQPLFGIPATGHLAFLRYGEFYRLGSNGRVAEVVAIWDVIGLMTMAGVSPLPRSAGVELLIPGPRAHDGVRPDDIDPEAGQVSKLRVEAMIAGLMQYDQRSLESMGQERFWSPDMTWYGPGGIGSNRRLKGFQDFHQRPFLTAFPDRKGGNHKARVGDGLYCASAGWPSIQATHAGPYLGQPATSRRITMRVMDWWRRQGDMLAENWVFIDLPDLFMQMGRDLFAEMRDIAARR